MTQTMDRTAQARVDAWLEQFEAALKARDVDAAAGMFATDSYWRDLVAFTWNIKTVEGREGIADLLSACLDGADPENFRTTETPAEADGVVEAWLEFETAAGRARGHLRLNDEGAWTFLTSLYELKGFEENKKETRSKGVRHGVIEDRLSWAEEREREQAELGYAQQPYVVVIGGGQGGIALGARLRQLGVPALVLERNDRPGDSWRKRYKSLCLHDPVWYDHLPYLPFPDNWPVFAPKDKIADWLEMYTRVMEVPYWTRSEVRSASYDGAQWTVEVDRDGETVTLHPKQLVFATGMSGKANVPSFPGAELFEGDQHHSSKHPGPEAYAGRKAVVIGSNNSAHDICAALWEHGADVTMVQRSSTHIVRSDSLMDIALGDLYSERAVAAGVTTDRADTIFASLPYRILPQFQIPVYQRIRERDADFYARLEKAGFDLDWGDDDSGLFLKYLRRGSGYYIDVGASELVTDGKIKLVRGQVDRLTKNTVVLSDGTELEADLVVYATGYGSMNGWVADLAGQEMADRVGKCWGLGSGTTKDPGPWEGEQRNMWKPTRQPGLWFQGGNLHQSRYYSLFLALQLKARFEGVPTPVYGLQEVHHLS
ncbi:putative flavoprotein involved in K+ transport [Lentzea albidocapillata subsp. violacea]|uniref:Putative flavoprotein involved in K+ transport n=1 Tax=Lentzea albidocapillata subsp. violacea TaxID=128104 RepID=A0A1G8QWZ6_9PSEU|nr:NAD(P)/FAD-dependent oxidoreductase [Lentzea albidocapillata]SDJ09133.1 putative flavoprotein involved in K+ transport [Lentzea albidocapillata subsp. violacea]